MLCDTESSFIHEVHVYKEATVDVSLNNPNLNSQKMHM